MVIVQPTAKTQRTQRKNFKKKKILHRWTTFYNKITKFSEIFSIYFLKNNPFALFASLRWTIKNYSTCPFRIRDIPSFINSSPKFNRYARFLPVNFRCARSASYTVSSNPGSSSNMKAHSIIHHDFSNFVFRHFFVPLCLRVRIIFPFPSFLRSFWPE